MKNKKWILIGLAVVAVIGLIVWLYSRAKSDTSVPVVVAEKSAIAVDNEIKAKVTQKMSEIKGDSNWYGNISKDSLGQGLTTVQGLANAAIWALKTDGIIPVDTYGAGVWGHKDYVKANY